MENQTTTKFKPWEDLDITDDFIFTRVMRNKKLCRTLLEMILKVKVGRIKFLTSHHAIQIDHWPEEGISIGLEQGAYQTKLETAKQMLLKGITIPLIVDCTNLPLETVLELAQTK